MAGQHLVVGPPEQPARGLPEQVDHPVPVGDHVAWPDRVRHVAPFPWIWRLVALIVGLSVGSPRSGQPTREGAEDRHGLLDPHQPGQAQKDDDVESHDEGRDTGRSEEAGLAEQPVQAALCAVRHQPSANPAAISSRTRNRTSTAVSSPPSRCRSRRYDTDAPTR